MDLLLSTAPEECCLELRTVLLSDDSARLRRLTVKKEELAAVTDMNNNTSSTFLDTSMGNVHVSPLQKNDKGRKNTSRRKKCRRTDRARRRAQMEAASEAADVAAVYKSLCAIAEERQRSSPSKVGSVRSYIAGGSSGADVASTAVAVFVEDLWTFVSRESGVVLRQDLWDQVAQRPGTVSSPVLRSHLRASLGSGPVTEIQLGRFLKSHRVLESAVNSLCCDGKTNNDDSDDAPMTMQDLMMSTDPREDHRDASAAAGATTTVVSRALLVSRERPSSRAVEVGDVVGHTTAPVTLDALMLEGEPEPQRGGRGATVRFRDEVKDKGCSEDVVDVVVAVDGDHRGVMRHRRLNTNINILKSTTTTPYDSVGMSVDEGKIIRRQTQNSAEDNDDDDDDYSHYVISKRDLQRLRVKEYERGIQRQLMLHDLDLRTRGDACIDGIGGKRDYVANPFVPNTYDGTHLYAQTYRHADILTTHKQKKKTNTFTEPSPSTFFLADDEREDEYNDQKDGVVVRLPSLHRLGRSLTRRRTELLAQSGCDDNNAKQKKSSMVQELRRRHRGSVKLAEQAHERRHRIQRTELPFSDVMELSKRKKKTVMPDVDGEEYGMIHAMMPRALLPPILRR